MLQRPTTSDGQQGEEGCFEGNDGLQNFPCIQWNRPETALEGDTKLLRAPRMFLKRVWQSDFWEKIEILYVFQVLFDLLWHVKIDNSFLSDALFTMGFFLSNFVILCNITYFLRIKANQVLRR